MPTYRQRWRQRYGARSAGSWETYEPGYRDAYELRSRPEYRGKTWSDVEPQIQRDWMQRNLGTPLGARAGKHTRYLGGATRLNMTCLAGVPRFAE